MKSILNYGGSATASDMAAFYKKGDPERFADLPDGPLVADVTDENGNVVEAGTLTAFFEEHPIECKDLTAFKAEVSKLLDVIVVDNLVQTIPFAFLMSGGDITQAQLLGTGLDEVCEALGIAQEKTANDVLGFVTYQGDKEGIL